MNKEKQGPIVYWLSVLFLIFIFFPIILPICCIISLFWNEKAADEANKKLYEEYKKKQLENKENENGVLRNERRTESQN